MQNQYSSVVVTGSISYDEIMDFPGKFKDHFHPERLHQINVSFVVDHLERQLGGTATNIVYNLSQIFNFQFSIFNQFQNPNFENNKPKITLLSSVGKDGKPFIEFFIKNSIDTKGLLVDESLYTAKGSVITDIADNQIWGFYYGACESARNINTLDYVDSKSLLIIAASHKDAFLHFQQDAINNALAYFYDPGMSLSWIADDDLRKGVIHAKYVIGNDYEIAMILKRLKITIKQLVHKGITVITTLGEEGVSYEAQVNKVHKVYKVRAYKVKKVVDPTGAGDSWRGGFIGGLVASDQGLDEEKKIIFALKLGNVMASFAIESYGTVNHKPSSDQIKNRLSVL